MFNMVAYRCLSQRIVIDMDRWIRMGVVNVTAANYWSEVVFLSCSVFCDSNRLLLEAWPRL